MQHDWDCLLGQSHLLLPQILSWSGSSAQAPSQCTLHSIQAQKTSSRITTLTIIIDWLFHYIESVKLVPESRKKQTQKPKTKTNTTLGLLNQALDSWPGQRNIFPAKSVICDSLSLHRTESLNRTPWRWMSSAPRESHRYLVSVSNSNLHWHKTSNK